MEALHPGRETHARVHEWNESRHMSLAGWHAMSLVASLQPHDELPCGDGCLLDCLFASALPTAFLAESV